MQFVLTGLFLLVFPPLAIVAVLAMVACNCVDFGKDCSDEL